MDQHSCFFLLGWMKIEQYSRSPFRYIYIAFCIYILFVYLSPSQRTILNVYFYYFQCGIWVFENSEGQQKIKINMRQWRDVNVVCARSPFFYNIIILYESEYIRLNCAVFWLVHLVFWMPTENRIIFNAIQCVIK